MVDREKVRTQLAGIGIGLDMAGYHNDAQCVRDALALLREQEPVKPIKREDWLFCGGCKTAIHNFLNYCPRCGKKVDWDV